MTANQKPNFLDFKGMTSGGGKSTKSPAAASSAAVSAAVLIDEEPSDYDNENPTNADQLLVVTIEKPPAAPAPLRSAEEQHVSAVEDQGKKRPRSVFDRLHHESTAASAAKKNVTTISESVSAATGE